jgi:hypothetical protein
MVMIVRSYGEFNNKNALEEIIFVLEHNLQQN